MLSGDGQPHSSVWKEIRLLLEAGGGFLYARIATIITKRITKKVKKSYFVIGLHPISGARFDRLPYRQHRVQYNISWYRKPDAEHLALNVLALWAAGMGLPSANPYNLVVHGPITT